MHACEKLLLLPLGSSIVLSKATSFFGCGEGDGRTTRQGWAPAVVNKEMETDRYVGDTKYFSTAKGTDSIPFVELKTPPTQCWVRNYVRKPLP